MGTDTWLRAMGDAEGSASVMGESGVSMARKLLSTLETWEEAAGAGQGLRAGVGRK